MNLWATLDAMSVEICAPVTAVRKWWQRDRIPAEWWVSVLSSPTAKAAGVSSDMLTELAARPTEDRRLVEARA